MDEPNANDENAIIADDDLNEVPEEVELPTDGFLLSGTASLLSIEDYKAIFDNPHPTANQWRDVAGPNSCNVSATIDGARKALWDQAQVEIKFVRGKVKAALGMKDATIRNLWDLILGPMISLLEEKIGLDKEHLRKVIGTYTLAAAYGLSKTQVFSKNSFVKVDGLTTEQDYQDFWNSVARCGCKESGKNEYVRGLRPLWMDMQHDLNETCRKLFVEGFSGFMRVLIDDDKMHYNIEKADTQGLKKSQHVRDNRKGFVAHTACYTASGLPIGIEWERSGDDTTAAATERLIRAQLSPMSGQHDLPMLANTEFCMDRGYCLPSLLFDFLLPSGADILGTMKRSPMFPFTYEQKLTSSDKRQLIEKKGFRNLFLKKLRARDKDITGIAYRDGKGGVTLALTTFEQTRHWDLVLANPLHRENSEKELLWYTSICEESYEDYKELFDNLPVKALTVKQNTPEWFLLRVFSCTSSSSDLLILELKQILLDRTTSSLLDQETSDALEYVLDFVHGKGWNQRAPILQAPQQPQQQECEPMSTSAEPTTPLVENITPLPENNENESLHDVIETNIMLFTSGMITDFEVELKSQVTSYSLDDAVVKIYLEKIGI